MAWHVLNSIPIISSSAEIEGGWGINESYGRNDYWYNNDKFTANVQNLSTNDVIVHSLFIPFGIHADKMHSLDPYDGSDENGQHGGLSGREWLRARFLSDAIPATSRAAGASGFDDGILAGNIQMDSGGRNGCMSNVDKWPKKDKRKQPIWEHSDFKQVAYYFVYKLFDKFVNGANK